MPLSERDIKIQVRDWLNKTLPRQKHYVSIGGFGTVKGQPDIIGCLDGKYFALETKPGSWKPPVDPSKTDKKITQGMLKTWQHYQNQVEQIEQIKAAGGLAGFCQSVEDAMAILGVDNVRLF